MPFISKNILNTTFYLYDTEKNARRGKSMGGTGFFVAYYDRNMTRQPVEPHFYAVTNWHVAVCSAASVIRVNCHDGSTDCFDFDPADWSFIPNGDDIAVVRVPLDPGKHQVDAISVDQFVRAEDLQWRISTGADVFMVGRFMDHDGGEINLPAVRFGNISTLPTLMRIEKFQGMREYYCIDLHSRTGFSGSPVFAYHTIGSDLTGNDIADLMKHISHNILGTSYIPTNFYQPYMRLLGIHCGQFPEELELKRTGLHKHANKEYVIGMSGMTMVSACCNILAVLELPQLEKQRAIVDGEETTRRDARRGPRWESASTNNKNASPPRARRKSARKR
jgi:hypothetical protein